MDNGVNVDVAIGAGLVENGVNVVGAIGAG